MQEGQQLTKKERQLIKKEDELQESARSEKVNRMRKWGIMSVIVLCLVGGLFWVLKESNKPLPGTAVEALGREHVEVGEKVPYNSNPPTSGSHYADWTKPGIYEAAPQDEYMVHSLEHGYIIVSYNCMKLNSKLKSQNSKFKVQSSKFQFVGKAYAHETDELHEEPATQSAAPTGSAWHSAACDKLKKQLSDLATEQKLVKLIVVPRENLNSPIALTAWARIDTMDTFDQDRIVRFIKAFRDQGPEKTME